MCVAFSNWLPIKMVNRSCFLSRTISTHQSSPGLPLPWYDTPLVWFKVRTISHHLMKDQPHHISTTVTVRNLLCTVHSPVQCPHHVFFKSTPCVFQVHGSTQQACMVCGLLYTLSGKNNFN